jgi:hypothetical protein
MVAGTNFSDSLACLLWGHYIFILIVSTTPSQNLFDVTKGAMEKREVLGLCRSE